MILLLEDKLTKVKEMIEHELKNGTQFGTEYNDDYCAIVENLNHSFYSKLPEARAWHGISKFAVVLNNCPWVIKVPFNGTWDNWYDEDEDEYHEEWREFCHADDSEEGSFDYCCNELDKYEKAVECGVGIFFAETKFYGFTEGGYPLYLQEKIRVDSHLRLADMPKASEDSLSLVKSKVDSRDYQWSKLSRDWMALAIDYYGEKLVEKFVDFICNIEPEIGQDLHAGNYGYREDGSPCILDFSGWRDWD